MHKYNICLRIRKYIISVHIIEILAHNQCVLLIICVNHDFFLLINIRIIINNLHMLRISWSTYHNDHQTKKFKNPMKNLKILWIFYKNKILSQLLASLECQLHPNYVQLLLLSLHTKFWCCSININENRKLAKFAIYISCFSN